MQKQYFDNEPQLVEYEGSLVRINFDVEHATEERQKQDSDKTEEVDVIKAYVVRVAHPLTRGRIVDAIVTAQYPEDRMQAVINNYLLDQEDADAVQEFNDMQAWRAHAKAIATQVMQSNE